MPYPSKDKAGGNKNKPLQKKPERRPSGKKEFKPPKKISEKYLYNSGLAYLQRFPASTHHFRSVMMRKIQKSCRFHKEQNIEDCQKWLEVLIKKFQELALLDDAAYLKGMVTSYRRRGLSSMQIAIKLSQKGYGREDVMDELQKHDQEEYHEMSNSNESGDIYAAIVFARKKRLGPFDRDNKKTPEKSLAAMARAGYSYEIAQKTLALTIEEIEERQLQDL